MARPYVSPDRDPPVAISAWSSKMNREFKPGDLVIRDTASPGRLVSEKWRTMEGIGVVVRLPEVAPGELRMVDGVWPAPPGGNPVRPVVVEWPSATSQHDPEDLLPARDHFRVRHADG